MNGYGSMNYSSHHLLNQDTRNDNYYDRNNRLNMSSTLYDFIRDNDSIDPVAGQNQMN